MLFPSNKFTISQIYTNLLLLIFVLVDFSKDFPERGELNVIFVNIITIFFCM